MAEVRIEGPAPSFPFGLPIGPCRVGAVVSAYRLGRSVTLATRNSAPDFAGATPPMSSLKVVVGLNYGGNAGDVHLNRRLWCPATNIPGWLIRLKFVELGDPWEAAGQFSQSTLFGGADGTG